MLSTASIWLIHGFMVLMVSNHHIVKIKTLSPPGAEIISKTGARLKVYYIENTLSLTLWKEMLSAASIWLIHGFMVCMPRHRGERSGKRRVPGRARPAEKERVRR